MQLVLLSAGKGSRLPGLYRKQPKSLVKVKKRSILDHNKNFYSKFTSKYIVTGYKSEKLKKFINENNFKSIKNFQYMKTNMVHSLFKVKSLKEKEIVVCYSDIIFDNSIFLNLKNVKNKNVILIKKNWLEIWKGRMSKKEILNDAEDLKVKGKVLTSIGGKIKKSLPKYQYMGIMKFKKKDFIKLKKFYFKINNKKIDFTSFLNSVIENRIIKINVLVTKKFWYEIDTFKDIKFTERNL